MSMPTGLVEDWMAPMLSNDSLGHSHRHLRPMVDGFDMEQGT